MLNGFSDEFLLELLVEVKSMVSYREKKLFNLSRHKIFPQELYNKILLHYHEANTLAGIITATLLVRGVVPPE